MALALHAFWVSWIPGQARVHFEAGFFNFDFLSFIFTLHPVHKLWYTPVMPKYPIYLDLTGRRVVVVGAGPVAVRKVQTLFEAGARVVVIAKKLHPVFEQTWGSLDLEVIIDNYCKPYLTGAVLAIAATNNPDLNSRIYKDCQELEILCNVVDVPDLCDFFVPAMVTRGKLQIAIGTDGVCPAYARKLRQKLEEIFTDTHGQFLDQLAALRKQIIAEIDEPDQRKEVLQKLIEDESFDYFTKNGPEKWLILAQDIIKA